MHCEEYFNIKLSQSFLSLTCYLFFYFQKQKEILSFTLPIFFTFKLSLEISNFISIIFIKFSILTSFSLINDHRKSFELLFFTHSLTLLLRLSCLFFNEDEDEFQFFFQHHPSLSLITTIKTKQRIEMRRKNTNHFKI